MLNEHDRRILDFEERYEHTPGGRKFVLVRSELGMSITHYYQRLGFLLTSPDGVAAHPQLAKRRLEREKRRKNKTNPAA